MKHLLLYGLFICWTTPLWGQVSYTARDEAIFGSYCDAIRGRKELPFNEVIVATARFFLSSPYVASTLEKEPEQLVVNLRELDCTTLVETVLALSRAAKSDTVTFETFCDNLRQIRYREGRIAGYVSRKHYTSDWIVENERAGIVKDITQEIGGKPFPVAVSFMSTHPDKYKQLAKDTSLVALMREKEAEINRRPYFYIPKEEIARVADKIRDGDIICFTTSIKGLDISHVGYAYWNKGKLSFIHASTSAHQVIVNPVPLADYIAVVKHNSGIMVVRPVSPGKKQSLF